jgi:hypothetical protein
MKIEAAKGWGIEFQWGGLAGASQMPECKDIAAEDVASLPGAKLVKVRVIRETDWKRIQKLLKQSTPPGTPRSGPARD